MTTTYTWDSRNRLTGLSRTGLTASVAYDGLGRRKTKTINGTTTGFWYDGNDVYAELSGATPSFTYIRGLNIDEPYVRKGASDEFYETDALGSSVALTNSAGAAQTTYTYEPFGTTTQAGTASTNPFQFTGRENDGTGLLYYRARYYSPRLQRFLREDPLRTNAAGEGNLYAYVLNDPINLVDPSGRLALVGALVGGGIDLAVQLVRNGGNVANVDLISVATSATAGATGVGLATAISTLGRGIGTQLVLNSLGSAGIGGAARLGQNMIAGKCLTQDVGRDALLSGLLGGLGFAAVNAQSAISAAAASTA